MSEGNRNSHLHSDGDRKLAKRRRKLPTAPPSGSLNRAEPQEPMPPAAVGKVEEGLKRLSAEVLKELQAIENSDKFMPGEIKDITKSDFSHSGGKRSQITLKSGKKLDVSLVEGSFRRITGIREQRDDSGSILLRRVEIKKEPGQSLGFYIREGDGWLRRDGIFVSRVNLGSCVETNGLLNVGDEITRVNNVDVTRMILDDVVLVMQVVKRMILTVKVIAGFSFSSDLSLHKLLLSRELPKPPPVSASGSPGRAFPSGSPRSEARTQRDIQERKLRFQRLREDSRAGSMMKVTNFGESFMRKIDNTSDQVEDSKVRGGEAVAINPYEAVSLNAKEGFAKSAESGSADISPYARVSLKAEGVIPQGGEQGGAGDKSEDISPYARVSLKLEERGRGERTVQKEISPYARVAIRVQEGEGSSHRANGSKEIAEISPYARVSMRVQEGEGSSHRANGSKGNAEIDPYARVSIRVQGEETSLVSGSHPPRVHHDREPDEISPYASVLKRGKGERIVVDVHPQSVVDNIEEAGSEEGGSRDAQSLGQGPRPHSELKVSDPYEHAQVQGGSQMRMDSLVALLRAKPALSSSPAVRRRSDIIDDIIVSPDHVYAQIDRTRRYNSSDGEGSEEEEEDEGGELEKKRNMSTSTPPPAPTSPLPHDDSMSVLPDILGRAGVSHEEDRRSSESQSCPSLQQHPPQTTSNHPEMPVLTPDKEAELEDSCDEDLDILLGEEGPPPPLPPPYVPDEGPPESSDEDDEGSRPDEGPPESSDEDDEGSRRLDCSDAGPSLKDLRVPEHSDFIVPTITVEVHEETSPLKVEPCSDVENLDRDATPLKVSTPVQQRKDQSNQTFTSEDGESIAPISLFGADASISLEDFFKDDPPSDSSDSDTPGPRFISRDSISSLPPPPPPPTEPPEDSEGSLSDTEDTGPFTLLDTSTQEGTVDGETDTSLVSGMIIMKVHSLNTGSEGSRTFWSNYDVQRVTFVSSVDGRVKITATVPIGERGTSDDNSEMEEYRFLVFKSNKIVFSVNPVCLPTITRTALLCDIFKSEADRLKQVYIEFEAYGHLKLLLEYRPISSVVRRVDITSYSRPSFSNLVNFNPGNSGCPLVLEQCMEVIERYGLKTPHLYERCAPVPHKNRALIACVENLDSQALKNVLVRCSVHAFTGLVMDFFQDLPEPFFTNDISSTLTQSASVMENTVEVLESFLLCLPEDEATTLDLLLGHFRRLIKHSERNGVTVKSIARLFGPLLLIPSLSHDLNTSATAFEYAEDYDSQARVIELLLTQGNT